MPSSLSLFCRSLRGRRGELQPHGKCLRGHIVAVSFDRRLQLRRRLDE